MEQIREVLAKNPNIHEELKFHISSLMDSFINCYPNLDKKEMSNKFGKMKMKALPKYTSKSLPSMFEDDTIYVNSNYLLSDDVDATNFLLMTVLNYLYPKDPSESPALYQGACNLICNSVVGGSNASDEAIVCDLLTRVNDSQQSNNIVSLADAFFASNLGLFRSSLLSAGLSIEDINRILNLSDQNFMAKSSMSQSNLPYIQLEILEACNRSSNFGSDLFCSLNSVIRRSSADFDEQFANNYSGFAIYVPSYDAIIAERTKETVKAI
ncbi:MAG: hypothetical protein PHD02_04770 [Bacilli bacterium]|nr:hypothetical protein [Bacilli bacterium]